MRETMKDVEFLLASSVYTHLLYLERPLLCPPWGRQAPWKGTELVVQMMVEQSSLDPLPSNLAKSIAYVTMFVHER
jgi:hypothetical protein